MPLDNTKRNTKSKKGRTIGIDLFSGAGGMSLGAAWAGIEVVAAVEADLHAAATFSVNHPDAVMLNERIESVTAIPFSRTKEDRLIIFGGPPCQGFSTSNQRTRGSSNPTNWLFTQYLRIVEMTMPDWVVFENVTGLSITENGRFLDAVVQGFKDLGYTAETFVLHAHEFGIPQRRSRLFIIASLHHEQLAVPKGICSQITVTDAISDLPVLRNGAAVDVKAYRCEPQSAYAREMRGGAASCGNHLVTRNAPYVVERFKSVPVGGNWSDIPPSQMKNYADPTRCHTGIYKRLHPRQPAVVIGNFRKNMLIHPSQHRGLSVREAARLQSFPDWFAFKGSIGFQQQQVGNAVPPLLAKAVFESIL